MQDAPRTHGGDCVSLLKLAAAYTIYCVQLEDFHLAYPNAVDQES